MTQQQCALSHFLFLPLSMGGQGERMFIEEEIERSIKESLSARRENGESMAKSWLAPQAAA